ncbi:MAG: thioredoxin-disulfide reductase [Weeksellaceae bacterium]
MDTIQNVVIIGGGPAGLSAAVYMARATLKPLVFAGSPPGGQLMLTTEVENFPGFHGIMGPDLVKKMRDQATEFGTQILDENVTSVDFTKSPFTIGYSDKTVQAKAVIIATGAQALWLGLESEQRLRGRGVSACATCDGFFFKNKDVAVVGGGDTAMEEAQTLTNFANKVYLIHRKETFRASKIMQDRVLNNPKIIPVLNNEILEVLGEQKVEGLQLKNKFNDSNTVNLNGLFLAIGHKPDTQLFKDKIELDEKGYIINTSVYAMSLLKGVKNTRSYDPEYQTQTLIPGVFAAGDCVDHVYRQAGTAAGMGIAASLDAERWLMNK